MAVAVMGASQQAAIPDVVKARAFHVIGKDGTALVKLEDTIGDGIGFAGTIRTYDGKGQELVELGVASGGRNQGKRHKARREAAAKVAARVAAKLCEGLWCLRSVVEDMVGVVLLVGWGCEVLS